MRRLFVSFGIVLGLLMIPAIDGAASASSGTALSPAVYAAATDANQAPQINVEIEKGGGKWYASPVWIAIGVIGAILVLILLVMAFRGGGTTVVHR